MRATLADEQILKGRDLGKSTQGIAIVGGSRSLAATMLAAVAATGIIDGQARLNAVVRKQEQEAAAEIKVVKRPRNVRSPIRYPRVNKSRRQIEKEVNAERYASGKQINDRDKLALDVASVKAKIKGDKRQKSYEKSMQRNYK